MPVTFRKSGVLLGRQAAVLESAAWKYSVPASGSASAGAAGAAGAVAGGGEDEWRQYRRVVADNYGPEDKDALLEYICMLKMLAGAAKEPCTKP